MFTNFWERRRETEREHEHEQGRSREIGRQNQKQALGSELSAQNLTWGSSSQPRDRDLSWSWTLNRLSHPGAPKEASWIVSYPLRNSGCEKLEEQDLAVLLSEEWRVFYCREVDKAQCLEMLIWGYASKDSIIVLTARTLCDGGHVLYLHCSLWWSPASRG